MSTQTEADAMSRPVICRHCQHLHDGGKVEVVQRYSDCSVWRCPNCTTLIDDRPTSWGGSATGQEVRDMLDRGRTWMRRF